MYKIPRYHSLKNIMDPIDIQEQNVNVFKQEEEDQLDLNTQLDQKVQINSQQDLQEHTTNEDTGQSFMKAQKIDLKLLDYYQTQKLSIRYTTSNQHQQMYTLSLAQQQLQQVKQQNQEAIVGNVAFGQIANQYINIAAISQSGQSGYNNYISSKGLSAIRNSMINPNYHNYQYNYPTKTIKTETKWWKIYFQHKYQLKKFALNLWNFLPLKDTITIDRMVNKNEKQSGKDVQFYGIIYNSQ